MTSASWSRAARGYELKVLSRSSGPNRSLAINHFDGFQAEVRSIEACKSESKTDCFRTMTGWQSSSRPGMALALSIEKEH